MADKIEYSRLLLKRTNIAGVVPTIPPVTATTLNQFTPTDIFVGEMFANVEDDRLWYRTNNGIVELNTSGSTGTTVVPDLVQVLNEGNNTGGFDISVSEGNTIIYQGLTSGGTSQYLGLDADGRTIIVTGSTGGSGTSGTSGSSGINGTSGSSGSSGVNGSNGSSGTSGISPVGLYLPLSGGTVTGNTYFGITSGITIDQVNNRFGINTANPSSTIEAFGTKSKINYDNTSGGVFQISGDTFLPRFSVAGAPSISRPLFGLSMGVRTYDDVTFPGYGKVGDGHLYASNEMNGLNIINRQSSGTSLDDYIRFYAGQDANGTTPDIHIQGSGSTRGFVGLGTANPTEKLHVVGNTRLAGDVFLPNVTSGASTTLLTIDPDTFEVFYTTGTTGGSGTSGSSGINGSSGTSGLSGVNGTSGVNGSTGPAGTSGTSGTSGGGGGGATGTHFAWELSPNSRYNLSLTSEYHEIEWNLWANQITLFPFTPARDVNVSGFSMSTTFTAGTPGTPQIVMCAYDHNVTTNLPGNLILSSSTITLQFPFVQHKYTTNYTFSAGTTYWLGYAFNNMASVTAGFAVTYDGLMTFAAPNTHCCDEPYKFAINTSYTFPTLPNPFTGTRYTGNGRPPEICILPR